MLRINECYPILIVPSNYGEGLSRSIIEALSLKIPVICSQTALGGTFNEKNLFYTIEIIVSFIKIKFLK